MLIALIIFCRKNIYRPAKDTGTLPRIVSFVTGKEFLERLSFEVIVGDGAMGTMLHAKGVPWEHNFDSINLTKPALVQSIHLEYIAAGAQFLETNTFGANANKLATTEFVNKVREINIDGVKLLKDIAPKNTVVAGSVGPLGPIRITGDGTLSFDEKLNIFKEQIVALAEGGVDCLILESFPFLEDLKIALEAAKNACDLPIICQLAILDRIGEEDEVNILNGLLSLIKNGASIIGGNCGSGPTYLLRLIQQLTKYTNERISSFPNASYPQYIEGRFVFISEPEYFANASMKLVDAGVNLIGGCCGTTSEHIRLVSEYVKDRKPVKRSIFPISALALKIVPIVPAKRPNILDKVGTKPVIVVEIDPPKGCGYEKVIEGVNIIKDAGVDAISIAENPLASVRMSSVVLGHLVEKSTSVRAIPHITCRDRNIIGQQSELLGAYALGLDMVLAITGDPASIGGALGATSVFDTNSYGLIELIMKLNSGYNLAGHSLAHPTSFTVGVAFDPNRTNMGSEIKRLERKIDLGARFALSQIVYEKDRVSEMYERTKHLGIPIFLGIMPLISAKNAEFLHNEVPGFKIPEKIRMRMKKVEENFSSGSSDGKDAMASVGVAIAKELIEEGLKSGAPGIYIVTPFTRYEMVRSLCSHIMSKVKSSSH